MQHQTNNPSSTHHRSGSTSHPCGASVSMAEVIGISSSWIEDWGWCKMWAAFGHGAIGQLRTPMQVEPPRTSSIGCCLACSCAAGYPIPSMTWTPSMKALRTESPKKPERLTWAIHGHLFKAMAEWDVCRLGHFLRQSCKAFSIFLVQLAITLVRSMLCDVEKVRGRGFAHDRMFVGVKGPLSMFHTYSSYLQILCNLISYHAYWFYISLHHS